MRSLHKILVFVPNICFGDDLDRDDLIDAVRDQAEIDTEIYQGSVFGCRKTENAGSYQDQYPCNVLFSADDLDLFLSELQDCYKKQMQKAEDAYKSIQASIGKDAKMAIDEIMGTNPNYDLGYHFGVLGDILSGHYTMESGFYDADASTARITQKTIQAVANDPKNWALAMFEYED